MTTPTADTNTTLITTLTAAGRAHIPTCLWGDPGTGKTSLIRALAEGENLPFETVIGSLREPTDFAGLPVITEEGVRMEPPAWAKRLHEHGAGIVFLDELSTAAPAVQAAMLGVVLDRVVGDLVLPRSVRVVAAANPPERAADGWDLTPPLANRLLHIDYDPSPDGWIDGMTAGFTHPAAAFVYEPSAARTSVARSQVAAFIRVRPDLLQCYPSDQNSTGRAWPSRRTWTMAADLLALLPDDEMDAALLATTGLVGIGAATEFLTWRRNCDLPDPADVLDAPEAVRWADLDPSRTWAILAGVVGYSTGLGTVDAWRKAWGPLATAADHGRADVAAACARTLLSARPTNATVPKVARRFAPALTAAGLMSGAAS